MWTSLILSEFSANDVTSENDWYLVRGLLWRQNELRIMIACGWIILHQLNRKCCESLEGSHVALTPRTWEELCSPDPADISLIVLCTSKLKPFEATATCSLHSPPVNYAWQPKWGKCQTSPPGLKLAGLITLIGSWKERQASGPRGLVCELGLRYICLQP